MSSLNPYQVQEQARKYGISVENKTYSQVQTEVEQAAKQQAQQMSEQYSDQAAQVIAKKQQKELDQKVVAAGVPDEAAGYTQQQKEAPEFVITTGGQRKTFKISDTMAGKFTRSQSPDFSGGVGPSAVLSKSIKEGMGPVTSVTGALRTGRDTLFSDPLSQARLRISESERQRDPVKSALGGGPFQTTKTSQAALDVGIGFVKGGESLVNPYVKTGTGAVVGSALSPVTKIGGIFIPSTAPAKPIESYLKDIGGRESELIGELAFDVVLGKAVGVGASKVKTGVAKKIRHTPIDDFLLKHSKRYRQGAEATLRQRPNIVSSPTFDVGQQSYTWSPGRQRAIDLAFDLELTPGSSGITAPALLETSTKTKLIPHLFSRGGQVSLGYLRETGFSRDPTYYKPGMQSAPQQIGIVTTTTRESSRALPYVPKAVSTVIGKPASNVLPGLLSSTLLAGVRSVEAQEKQAQQVEPKLSTPTKPIQELTPEVTQTESLREIPFTPPTFATPQRTQQESIPFRIPDLTVTPKAPQTPKQIPDVLTVPGVISETRQDQATALLPQTAQIVKSLQVPKQISQQKPALPTPQVFRPTLARPPPVPQMFRLPKSRGRGPRRLGEAWRLKEHKIPTLKELTDIGTKKKKKGGKGRILKPFKI